MTYRPYPAVTPFETCWDCEGTGYIGTLEDEELIIEALRWADGLIVVGDANRMAEFASMIDSGMAVAA